MLVQEKDEFVRRQAALALYQIGDASAIPVLVKLLENDKSNAVRGTAAYGLGQLRQPEALPVLSALLQAKSDDDEMLNKALAGVLELASVDRNQAMETLRTVMSKGVNIGLRPRIITEIGKANYTSAAPDIETILAQVDDEVTRRAAIRALATLQGAGSIPALAKLLQEEGQTRLQLRVIEQFRELDDPAAIQPMCQALIDIQEETVRDAAQVGLEGSAWLEK